MRRIFSRSGSPTRLHRSYLEKIGGEAALEAFLEAFCERILADDALMVFFRGVNIDKYKEHQTKFMRLALNQTPQAIDQPRSLSKEVRHSHLRFFEMGLNETHFDRVVEHMAKAMQEVQVRDRYIDEIRSKVLLPYREVFLVKKRSTASSKPALLHNYGDDVVLETSNL